MTTEKKSPKNNRLEVYRSATGWHWRIVATNGRVLATSPQGDGYERRQRAMDVAQKIAAPLDILVKE